ncbi:hypothetical protein L228DRAFT_286336 [Xylona heveae TC161]|uniref:Uncharacterized protein n=1 Tax=Xylona heveae (strain CBS 132557 / TC161) TaxID=1328760 RepID=A0A164Z992_XYLHT|nr:hypothetical protein L228DRAFT_286336 [Xylona heveae TC161]KZF18838.1 hypothetical protein L228DRAFT_286336 [Xylona heveae TC161]
MANQVTLLAYLQHGPPTLPVIDNGSSHDNTTSKSYSAEDISQVGVWSSFNLNTIMQQFQPLLANARIEDEAMPTSPPQAINSETGLQQRFSFYLNARVRRSLRVGFHYLATNNQLLNHTVVSFAEGSLAQMVNTYRPDTAYFDSNLPTLTRPNRAPGELKPSYKWSLSLRDSPASKQTREFKQALSQVNYYMNQHKARFGFILTDRELVAIRRLDNAGSMELSESIPWSAQGTQHQPRLTVLLALWYLGMLASDDQQWSLP